MRRGVPACGVHLMTALARMLVVARSVRDSLLICLEIRNDSRAALYRLRLKRPVQERAITGAN